MPHIIVEHSANLTQHININTLLQSLHDAALETGIFPIGGLRTRAEPRENYVIADDHPDNVFIHVMLRIGHGRDFATKKQAGDHIFGALCGFLEETFENTPLGISLEIQEIDPDLSFKKNNLHEILKSRKQ